MLAHLIHYEGKGGWVLGLPILIALIFFTVFNLLNLNELYVRSLTFLLSAFILWFVDGGPAMLRDWPNNTKSKKNKNRFMWIEMKYWALLMGVIGCVLLGIK